MSRFFGNFWKNNNNRKAINIVHLASEIENWEVFENKYITIAYDPTFSQLHQYKDIFFLLSGTLLLDECSNDEEDIRKLSSMINADKFHAMRACRGNFVLIFWSEEKSEEIFLATDCLSSRPIYWWENDGGVGFAGQAKLAHRFGDLDTMQWNERGILEHFAFGYPLGTHTDHPDLSVLDYATICAVNSNGISHCPYHRWRTREPQPLPLDQRAENLLTSFRSAVAARASRFGADNCLLSGGMDSRMIALELRRTGYDPVFHSFAHPTSLDFQISNKLAKEWSARLNCTSLNSVDASSLGGIPKIASDVVHKYYMGKNKDLIRIWSGDGGSVCLGGVYLDEQILNLAEKNFYGALDKFCTKNACSIPRKILSRHAHYFSSTSAIEKEILRFQGNLNIYGLFHFLLSNDQRRHIWDLFENCEELNIELITPFFDPVFLDQVDSCPISDIIAHKVYTRIFDLLPDEARCVGWQTYPGHEPCAIPLPVNALAQWKRPPQSLDLRARRGRAVKVIQSLAKKNWPSRIIPRWRAAVAALLLLLGKHSISYLVKNSHIVSTYLKTRSDFDL